MAAPLIQLEASGGVNLATVRALAHSGVDRISVGALTHSAPALDLALDFESEPVPDRLAAASRPKMRKAFVLESDRKPIVPSSTPVPPSLNIPLLNRLRAAEGDYVPLGELGPDLERLRCELDALAAFGFGVEQHPYRGAAYRGPARAALSRPDRARSGDRAGSGGGSRSGTESRAPTIWPRGRERRRPTTAWWFWPRSRRPAEAAGDGRGRPLPVRRS